MSPGPMRSHLKANDDEAVEGMNADEWENHVEPLKPEGVPSNGRAKLLYQIILAVVAAGGAGSWLKPEDDTAARTTYEATRGAIESVNRDIDGHDQDLDELHDWRHDMERKLSRLQAQCKQAIDISITPEPPEQHDPDPDVEAELEDYPPRHPRPSKRPDRPPQAKPVLPTADELL